MSVTSLFRWFFILFFIVATFLVLKPFLGVIMLGSILVISTWPLNNQFKRIIKRPALRATILIFLWMIILIGPLFWLGSILGDNAQSSVTYLKDYFKSYGIPELPSFIKNIPLIGSGISEYWYKLTHSKGEITKILQNFMNPAKNISVDLVQNILKASVQMLGVLFVSWFLYFDGDRVSDWIKKIALKIDDKISLSLLAESVLTIQAVLLGIVGAAIGQSIAMFIGLLIAGIPQLGLLSIATFFLSLIPGGTVLIWLGASLWLYNNESYGMMVFMLIWGALVVSSVDNILKPVLMSKGTNQSLLVITIGVFGGALTFGFIGLFIGPVILAVSIRLLNVWLDSENYKDNSI